MNSDLMKICMPGTDDFDRQIQEIEQAGYRYEFEERAAILEYDGGLVRDDAEKIAAKEIINRYALKGNTNGKL